MNGVAVPPDLGGKYLTFHLGTEEYGIEILKVREIIGLMPITRVPRTPPSVLGVINLRGKVIPVVDLRLRFGMEAVVAQARTCIIVVYAAGVEFGLVVDSVSDVADVEAGDVEAPPELGTGVDTQFLLGIAKKDDSVRLLLDIDRVLSTQEVAALRVAAEGDVALAETPASSNTDHDNSSTEVRELS